MDKQWWRSLTACRTLDSFAKIWTYFSEAFVRRFVPYSLRDQISFITWSRYPYYGVLGTFYALSGYATTSISTDSKRIKKFFKDLEGYYQLNIAQMVVSRSYFQSIVKYTKLIESIRQDTQGSDSAKKIYQQGNFSWHIS